MDSILNYPRPSVAADAAVFGVAELDAADPKSLRRRTLNILLVRRGEEPFCGEYSLPGGFLRPGETIEEAACRELTEETGVMQPRILPLKTYSAPDRDPRGWIISCAFLALTRTVQLSTAEHSDAACAQWFELSYDRDGAEEIITLTGADTAMTLRYRDGRAQERILAFDHAEILRDAFLRLRDEVEHHDLIFELMPPLFAVSDLQQPYELITGRHTSPQNFRKKMASKIEVTGQYDSAAAHRTSRLYQRKNDTEGRNAE
jgi:ADP-ribose pyrophosphatase YjhB (NUDIX family)